MILVRYWFLSLWTNRFYYSDHFTDKISLSLIWSYAIVESKYVLPAFFGNFFVAFESALRTIFWLCAPVIDLLSTFRHIWLSKNTLSFTYISNPFFWVCSLLPTGYLFRRALIVCPLVGCHARRFMLSKSPFQLFCLCELLSSLSVPSGKPSFGTVKRDLPVRD